MKGLINTRLILIILAALTIAGCSKQKKAESAGIYDYHETDGFTRADSIIDKLSDLRDYDWMLRATDSLYKKGELSKSKYIFYSTVTLNLLNQQLTSLKLYYQLDTLDLREIKTQTDIESYVYSYNNYIRMLCDMRRYDRALRETNKADQRLKWIGYTTFTEHHDIAQITGESQLYMGQEDSAAISFQRSLNGIHKRLVNHHNPLDLRECQKTMNAIAKCYMHKGLFYKVDRWIKIQDSLYVMAQNYPEPDSVYLDEMQAEINYSKALLAIKQGKKDVAEKAYKLYKQTNTAKTLYNIVNDNEYLMWSGRFAEAARNFERLDEFLLTNGYKCDLENIGRYMIPKYRANMLAGRRDSAIKVANIIADYYQQALTDQKINDADLLTMVYDTEGKERQLVEKEAELSHQRLLAVGVITILVVIFFYFYAITRSKAYKKLDDTNKQLKLANQRAEESNRIKSKFIKQISHEVRTPLNVLSGFTQVLANKDIEIDSNELQLISQNGINKARHLVLELQEEPEAEVTHIHTNLKAAVKALAMLLDNAMKFTHPLAFKGAAPDNKARVTIIINMSDNKVTFIVEDTGIGIPAYQAENIFTEFVQLDEYTDGTGIGLSIARSLARHMNGNVELDTSYTGGARFIMTLPLI